MKGLLACSMPATGPPRATAITNRMPTPISTRLACRSVRRAIPPSRPDAWGGGTAGADGGGAAPDGDPSASDGWGTLRMRVASESAPRSTVAPGSPSRSTVRVVVPSLIVSPGWIGVGPAILRSLTNVPLLEPRSSIISCPSASHTLACRRESSGSWASAAAASPSPGSRPITSGSAPSRRTAPADWPSLTRSEGISVAAFGGVEHVLLAYRRESDDAADGGDDRGEHEDRPQPTGVAHMRDGDEARAKRER